MTKHEKSKSPPSLSRVGGAAYRTRAAIGSRGEFVKQAEATSLTPRFTADSVAETDTDHLLGSLFRHPALADEIGKSRVRPTGTLLGGLGDGGRVVNRGLDVSDHTRASAWNETLGSGGDIT